MVEITRLEEGDIIAIPAVAFQAIWAVVLAARDYAEESNNPELCEALHRLADLGETVQ